MKRRKPNKKDAILRATLELVAERGFHGAPAAEIAAKAGVGIGTIYRYYESKDELIIAVMKDLEEKVAEKLFGQGYTDNGTVQDRFTHIVRGILLYNIDNPLEFRFIEQFMNSPYGAAYRSDRMYGEPGVGGVGSVLRGLFMEGISSGEVKDLPIPMLHNLTFGPVNLAMRDHTLGLMYLNEDLINATVEACWDSVRAARQ